MIDQKYIPVRLSHLFFHSSVGAIVRADDYLLVIMDIRRWTDGRGRRAGEYIPYVDQVRSALSIEKDLIRPPVARVLSDGRIQGACIPAVRFPKWMKCPGCGLLSHAPWRRGNDEIRPRCLECGSNRQLEQAPWVLVHSAGYLADVDWHFLAHRNRRSNSPCERDNRSAYLKIEAEPGSNAQVVICTRCGARSRFRPGTPLPWGQTGQQPWIPEPPEINGESEGTVLAVNDVRIHETRNNTAIVIPPESRIARGTPLDRLYCNSQKRKAIDQACNERARQAQVKKAARELGCLPHDIERALSEIKKGFPLYGEVFTKGLLYESEYKALVEPITDVREDEDFVTCHFTREWQALRQDTRVTGRLLQVAKAVDQLVAVNRLRAIMVLMGFSRKGGDMVPPDMEGESQWLPALELFGEGIFFTLEESLLNKWENQDQVTARASGFQKRKEHSGLRFEPDVRATPRFLLLHTLAHMIIRHLEALAGYPAASLKERIYCRTDKNPMAGILIYVAVPDKYGSLGGLCELAQPEVFLKMMKSVFDHADWCSLDPVCSEHEGQGPHLLNRAACHGCALIPEPACSYKNVLLDRTFLSGQTAGLEGSALGFLNFIETG